MKIQVDTHTHSVASLHAYSTINELARSARRNKLKGFVISEHGPALQGQPHPYYFGNLKVLPAKLYGVRIFHGVELNIIDDAGGVDLSPRYLKLLDFVMAGLHEVCFSPKDTETNTKALIQVIKNPLVDGISHPGNGAFPVDYEEIARTAAEYGKTIEINNSSFKVRGGSGVNCRLIAKFCKQYGTPITCGSDAHYCADIGIFDLAMQVINEAGIEKEQVVNSTLSGWTDFCNKRKAERFQVRKAAQN